MGLANKLAKKKKKAKIMEQVAEVYKNRATIITAVQDTSIILMTAARDVFGFGEKRLKRLYEKMRVHVSCIHKNYVTTQEIAQILQEEAKLEFHCAATGEKVDIFDKIADELSLAFMISLMDVYGFKGKLIKRVYDFAMSISEDIKEGRQKVDELEKRLAEEANFGVKIRGVI